MPHSLRPPIRPGQWLQFAAEPSRLICSQALHDLLGYPRGAPELAPPLFQRIVHPDDSFRLAVFRDTMSRANFGEHAVECRLRKADGPWLDVRISSLTFEDVGSPVISGMVAPLERPVPLPASLAAITTHRALQTTRSAVFIFSCTGALTYANPAAIDIAGKRTGAGQWGEIDPAVIQDLLRIVGKTDEAGDALMETAFGGREWLCHAVTLTNEAGAPAGTAVFCYDITRIHESAEQRVAAEQELTRALVKEVHHRIKNNLQATVGLLRQHTLERDDSSVGLGKGISQLLSIAAVHGIQARVHEDRIYLCSVVAEVVRTARATSPIRIDAPGALRRFALDEPHAVQIALIVNELVTNALKYTGPAGRIDVAIDDEVDGVRLTVTNTPARLPDGFDLASGAELGAGLRLVKSLLPRGRSSLTIATRDGAVSAELRIDAPIVIHCDPQAAC